MQTHNDTRRGEQCEPEKKTPKYIDKVNYYEGIITEVHDGSVALDIKGRLGSIRIPKRMIISDYELKVGQEVAFNMSFIEQLSASVNEHYIKKSSKTRSDNENNE
ncbi:MAG: hypothetical protein J6P02_01895 [Lachnospiraceae bacterium]|nr:hypothetical protein [Lachnospiraceae bacterium]